MESIEQRVREGDHYGALQTLRTLLVRANKKNKLDRVAQLGRDGSVVLLKNNHGTEGLDVSLNLIDLWEQSAQKVTAATKEIVKDINDAYVEGIKDKIESGRLNARFLDAAIDWSKAENGCGEFKKGEPMFHHMAAKARIRSGDLTDVCHHYIHAHQPKELAAFVFQSCRTQSDRDLYLAGTIFQLLAEENLKDANICFDTYSAICIAKKTKLNTPLYTFTKYLLRTLERDAYPLFAVLRQKYADDLCVQPNLNVSLDTVQEKFYKVKPKKQGMAAMMENMFGMFGAPPK
eukprot:CAMPEP_0184027768 /NCGR_PEP_ID=MMETSP0954-20121128/14395_1 /TAXON_ID=627963 /ORGANISM="Aplanochytrium sp, Strain PBS07" /LENGTH=289 /DNA_ID=CAMNT_0026312391 /DNA_START=43 /DNA_END=912 /DNA_ORIENTATION=+